MKKKHSKYSKWYIIICFPFLSQLIRFFLYFLIFDSILYWTDSFTLYENGNSTTDETGSSYLFCLSFPFCFLCVYLLLNPIKAISVGSQFFFCYCWASIHLYGEKRENLKKKHGTEWLNSLLNIIIIQQRKFEFFRLLNRNNTYECDEE